MDILRRSAFFWDYENVPLRRKDRGRFLWAIVNMLDTFTFDFQRIYARRSTMSSHDYNQLLEKGFDKEKHSFLNENILFNSYYSYPGIHKLYRYSVFPEYSLMNCFYMHLRGYHKRF